MPDEQQPDPVKSGFKSSEFYVSILVAIAGLFLMVYGEIKDRDTLIIVGSGLLGTTGIVYPAARTIQKR